MLKRLSSTVITVVCLLLLFILTFWGTVAQVKQGLYAAQERFFASFFFLAGGWFPFPGAQLVLWVLFINLLAATVVYFRKYRQWTQIGLKIIHAGLLLYFVAAFCVFHLAKESYVQLAEGESTNLSSAYSEWELAYWQGSSSTRQITAIDTKSFRPGYHVPFSQKDFSLTVLDYYPNAQAYQSSMPLEALSVQRISSILAKPVEKEREKNFAGLILNITARGKTQKLLLYGAATQPVRLGLGKKDYYFMLRHKRYPLPVVIALDHFKAEFHPGTNTAKSYESLVTISTGQLNRQVRIYMNNPLRFKEYAFYQASYSVDSMGRQYSTLAVVRNSAQILPYIACLVVFLGLAVHFLIRGLMVKRNESH